MGRKTAKSNQASSTNKSADITTDKKKSTKSLRKSKGADELDLDYLSGDIDSLKNMKEKTNSKDTDNKIKNLMSELLSLVGDSLNNETNGSIKKTEKSISSTSQICNENPGKPKNFNDDIVIEDSCSTPCKKSENVRDRNSPEILLSLGPSSFSNCVNTDNKFRQKSSKKLKNSLDNENSEKSFLFKNYTSHKETEKLVYKSFVLKNLQKYLSSSEESVCELGTSSTNKSNKNKGKTCKRRNKKNYTQRKRSRGVANQRGRKRRLEPECDIEVIHSKLNSLSCSPRNKIPEVDIDFESLDWDEPFLLDDTSEKSSFDVEIIESDTETASTVPKRKKSSKSQEKNVDLNVSKSSTSGSGTKGKNWECPICFESSVGQEIVTTLCGHVFCRKCIEKYNSSKENTCPTCRSDLTNKSLITLFNF